MKVRVREALNMTEQPEKIRLSGGADLVRSRSIDICESVSLIGLAACI